MKLCPECDFIYEDDQAVCDMDGKQLVPQPIPESVSSPVAASAPKVSSHGSKRWFALAAGLALLLAVIAVAYVSQASQKRAYAASSPIPSVAVETTPQPVSVPKETPEAVDTAEANNANAAAREASTKMLTNVAATAANAGSSANEAGRVILRLTNGATISADDAWPGKNGVWYRQGGLVTFLKGNQLKAIERIPASRRTNTPTSDKIEKPKTQTAAAPNSLRLKRLEPATPQKPSRMTSFLRKTGDFLKKPFKR